MPDSKNKPPIIDCLIMAAGQGARLGAAAPKQYQTLAGQPVLRRAAEIFLTHPRLRRVHIVIGAGQEALYQKVLQDLDMPAPITGGARRQDSVRLGLDQLAANPPDYVLIADAARIFTTHDLISQVIAALGPENGVMAAVPLTDTLKQRQDGALQTLPRTHLWQAQTPQAFPFAAIHRLHHEYKAQDVTDDAALFEMAGLPVIIVPSSARNFKITTAEEFTMAEALLKSNSETRIGQGYDVHRFCAGDHVMLGGVKIPHHQGIEAHSDGDVILHALTDAILGTIGAGDIGQHFPPSDPQWRGASSGQFVRHAMHLLTAAGGRIINADITLLAEAPKIGPHRSALQKTIAALLYIETTRVNIKATTTEKLGFIGRAEGLAAQAVVIAQL